MQIKERKLQAYVVIYLSLLNWDSQCLKFIVVSFVLEHQFLCTLNLKQPQDLSHFTQTLLIWRLNCRLILDHQFLHTLILSLCGITLSISESRRWICQNHGDSPWFWYIQRDTKHTFKQILKPSHFSQEIIFC
jgi:hypothetical protein